MKLELQELRVIKNVVEDDKNTQLPHFHYQAPSRRHHHSVIYKKRKQKIAIFKLVTFLTTVFIVAIITVAIIPHRPTEIGIKTTYQISIR